MTGISDVVRSARSFSRLILTQRWTRPVLRFLPWCNSVMADVPTLDGMPTPKIGYFQEVSDACCLTADALDWGRGRASGSHTSSATSVKNKWGLLLPVCCRSSDGGESCFAMLQEFAASLDRTTSSEDKGLIAIYVGIDQHDVFYDHGDTQKRIKDLFRDVGIADVTFSTLRSHYRGKLCRIWDLLASQAVEEGCSFVVLLGDDVRLESPGWKGEIEDRFEQVSASSGLPLGVACVAFRDMNFPVFPTFPVIHRHLFEVFGYLLPVDFINQHGDPFLFELYRRFGTSEFAPTASLVNTIGGTGDARYSKHNFKWQTKVLTAAVDRVSCFLSSSGQASCPAAVPCINVVVPSYRCNLGMLRGITTLSAASPASVHVLVVVDNPAIPLGPLREQLEDWSPNHLVRFYPNEQNVGASQSRNIGIASSFGDWVVLLDDDVVPSTSLLDAYLGATQRHPEAMILVGLTSLPAPTTLMQRALAASQMTFFYDVARRMANPPWGVTANLCVKGRSTHGVWFSSDYPRTGGGEDVDYCLRIKELYPHHTRNEVIVAVPEAKAEHPFWSNISKQVIGWALGDVRCLSALPLKTFLAPPNWIESLLLFAVYLCMCAYGSSDSNTETGLGSQMRWFVAVAVRVVLLEVATKAVVSYHHTPRSLSFAHKVLISVVSAYPTMAQDVARLLSKLSRLQLSHICVQFDWMDGQRDHAVATRFSEAVKGGVRIDIVVTTGWPVCWVSSPWSLLCSLSFWPAFLWLWKTMSDFSREKEQDNLRSQLEPLPMNLPADGPQAFVILAFQRTGSNLLCGKLHNHYQVVMHNEVFNFAKIWTYQTEDVLADPTWHWDIFSRDSNPMAFLDDIFHREPIKKKAWRAVGFKLFPDHWTAKNQEALQRVLADKRVKKIIIRREDYLAVYASKLRADKTGAYIRKSLDEIPLHIDLGAFDSFIKYYDACYAYYDLFLQGQEVLRVTYEEVSAAGPTGDAAMRKVLDFLRVDSSFIPQPLDVTVKQTVRPLSQAITNYEELEKAFKHHPKFANRSDAFAQY